MTPVSGPAMLHAPDNAVALGERPFVLAHLSDPHLPHSLHAWPTALLNKRAFGYLSWRLRRVRVHRREVLEALVDDLAAAAADHVAVTGDIVNIALPVEFVRAAEWLHRLGTPANVTAVPGNHDAYVAVSWEQSWAAWREFMSSDGAGGVPSVASKAGDAFPILRRRGPLAVIGLSTAVPSIPGHSSGEVGQVQLDRLARHLAGTGADGLFRVVLLHHPPRAPDAPRHKRLTDADRFCQVIAEAGAELILHGHEHRFRFVELAGPHGIVPVFGVPSASMLPRRPGIPEAQYHLHLIVRRDTGWLLETRVRSYSATHKQFVESRRSTLLLAHPSSAATQPLASTAAAHV